MSARSEYQTWHRLVTEAHGKAIHNACAWCGCDAAEWAYDWRDPKQREEDGYVWSENTAHYIPLCRIDHRTFDAAYRRVGLSGLAAEVARLKPLAWDRETDEKRAAQSRLRSALFDVHEMAYNAKLDEQLAKDEIRQARIRAKIAANNAREAVKLLKLHGHMEGFFPGVLVEADITARVLGAAAFKLYEEWCTAQEIPPTIRMRRNSFYRAMESRGALSHKTTKGIALFGVQIQGEPS
ncbi:hypothetical protein [Streptomyces sp. DSM 40907]|uniref:hypothetical protein n=1 Tax=Streptomyces kutzneri TaxID=3051179 RepID=UPI0028D8E0A0|nr:hypothetical protein [Streptomyces sp. DSM 40907]